MNALGKEKIKYLKSLGSKKYRQKYNKFVVEGHKIINDIPTYWEDRVDIIYYTNLSMNIKLKERFGDRYVCIREDSMESISQLSTNPGCLTVIHGCDYQIIPKKIIGKYIFLEEINNPGNLGTIVRTAEWFGINNVIISPKSVDFYNPKVLQATMGALWSAHVFQCDLAFIPKEGVKVFVADMDGKDHRSINWAGNMIMVFGNESHGISKEAVKCADEIVSIKGNPNAIIDSLNIAISAGIIISEIK